MSQFFSLTIFIAIVAITSCGCTDSGVPTSDTTANSADHTDDDHSTTTIYVAGKICGACGTEKGSEECCNESVSKCELCGKNKGSLLCCVELADAVVGKDLCGKCGHVSGSEACCAEDAEKCADCGLAKGSALCCKLKPVE